MSEITEEGTDTRELGPNAPPLPVVDEVDEANVTGDGGGRCCFGQMLSALFILCAGNDNSGENNPLHGDANVETGSSSGRATFYEVNVTGRRGGRGCFRQMLSALFTLCTGNENSGEHNPLLGGGDVETGNSSGRATVDEANVTGGGGERGCFGQMLSALFTLCAGTDDFGENNPLIGGGNVKTGSSSGRAHTTVDAAAAAATVRRCEPPATAATATGLKAYFTRCFFRCFTLAADASEWKYFVEVSHDSLRWLVGLILLFIPANYFKEQEAAAAAAQMKPISSSVNQTSMLFILKANYGSIFLPTVVVYVTVYLASFFFRKRGCIIFLQSLSLIAGVAMVVQTVVFAGVDPSSYLAGVGTALAICFSSLFVFRMVDCNP